MQATYICKTAMLELFSYIISIQPCIKQLAYILYKLSDGGNACNAKPLACNHAMNRKTVPCMNILVTATLEMFSHYYLTM